MEKVTVRRIGDTQFEFEIINSADVTKNVYLLNKPCFEDEQLLLTTNEEKFVVNVENIDYRPYFAVDYEGKVLIVAERTLPVDGMNNFRDLGGYETADGHHVKWGKLYRSDHIYNATSKGVEYIQKLGLKSIVDYRSENERVKYPNKEVSSDVVTFWFDPDAHTAELAAQFTSSKNAEDENLVNKIIAQKNNGSLVNRYDMVMEQYSNFVNKDKCKEAFSEMIKVAANPDNCPMVQHCRGGKDRTGFGSLLLLGILGVSKEDIVNDYMITHFNRIERNNVKMEKYKKFTQDPAILDYLYSLIDTKPEFIGSSYDKIVEKYGTIEEYAKQELNVSENDIMILKKNYLE